MSIAFPLAFLLIPFAAAMLVVVVIAAVSMAHLVHYGETARVNFIAAFAFVAGAALILFFTSQALAGTNWSADRELSLPIFGLSPSPDFPSP